MLSVATDYICASSSLRPNQRENMLPLQILAIIFYVIKIHEYLELSYKQVNAKIQFFKLSQYFNASKFTTKLLFEELQQFVSSMVFLF